uniref:Uncharacterized protein n=1 Tax=Megaselia scalaris TaxID=36166 RepID=T1H500_MEGSC
MCLNRLSVCILTALDPLQQQNSFKRRIQLMIQGALKDFDVQHMMDGELIITMNCTNSKTSRLDKNQSKTFNMCMSCGNNTVKYTIFFSNNLAHERGRSCPHAR